MKWIITILAIMALMVAGCATTTPTTEQIEEVTELNQTEEIDMQLKEDIAKQIEWKNADIDRISNKLEDYNRTLTKLQETDKKSETIKYLKEEIKGYNIVLDVYNKDMVVLRAILEE